MNGPEAFVFGEWISQPEWTTNRVAEIVHEARRRKSLLRAVPANDLCEVIGALGPLWAQGGKYHREFLQRVPWKFLGLSRRMVEIGLDYFAKCLDSNVARKRIQTQLGELAYLDNFVGNEDRMLRAEPLGIVLHIVSENVFFGPAQSILAGLLCKNINIVKRPSSSGGFLSFFMRSLQEVAPKEAASVALLGWQSGSQEIEEILSKEADGILVAAGPETISSYRQKASPVTQLIEFGPRVSIAVISAKGMESLDFHDLAFDIALWDQLACTAAQCIYVEGWKNVQVVTERLASTLEMLEFELPEGEAALDERIEVARLREIARFGQAHGKTSVFSSRHGGTWTVVCEIDPAFMFSPLRRCVRIKPYASFDELMEALRPVRGLVQTAGLATGGPEQLAYEECLMVCGIRRICNIGRMNEPSPAGLHDGMMELQRLVRWVEREKIG